MKKILLLALLLCKCLAIIDVNVELTEQNDVYGRNYITDNIVALATRSNVFDYEDIEGTKRHSLVDDRRNWRKKALLKSVFDSKDWSDRRKPEYDSTRLLDELDAKGFAEKDSDLGGFRNQRRYNDGDKILSQGIKSVELGHFSSDKEIEKKSIAAMNCERVHERFEPCFSGCAAITCDNPRERLRPCYPFCEPGCICVHPYIRDDRTHKCVLPDDCSKSLKGIPDLGDDI